MNIKLLKAKMVLRFAATGIVLLALGCASPSDQGKRVAAPSFIPAAGTYSEAQNIVISSQTAGTTIHFSSDGTPPGPSSPVYSTPVRVFGSGTKTIMALASMPGLEDSDVAIAHYVISQPALWAQTVHSAPSYSVFNSVAADDAGNAYAAGGIGQTGTYDFGNGVSVTGLYFQDNAVLVKYDPSGVPKWARTVTSAPSASSFTSVAVDAAGNVYAAGIIYGTGSYSFGGGTSVAGTNGAADSLVLVKYDSSGRAQWAKSVTAGSLNSGSRYRSLTADAAGNVYAAGAIFGTATYGFGNGKSCAGVTSGWNVVLAKYDSSGLAQWVRTASAGPSDSEYTAVALDVSGNVYAAGVISGTGTFGFGNGATAAGTMSGPYSSNALLVKYDASGSAQWARSVTAGSMYSGFESVSADDAGNICAAGVIYGNGTYGFGNGVTATGACPNENNPVLVKYDASGSTKWAQTTTLGSSGSLYLGVALDNAGNVYAAGRVSGKGVFGFSNAVTMTGSNPSESILLVKYNPAGEAQWAQGVAPASFASYLDAVALDPTDCIYAVGTIGGASLMDFGNGVTVGGAGGASNAVIVKYGP